MKLFSSPLLGIAWLSFELIIDATLFVYLLRMIITDSYSFNFLLLVFIYMLISTIINLKFKEQL